jgi:hypothetical protein
MDNISICITLKDRADYLDIRLHDLQFQNYDLKKVEICIADGGSSDNIKEVIEKWHKKFYQIKFSFCDREVLPFKIASNCPACDRNSMICNMASFEKVIVTDPEVLFTNVNQLQSVSLDLNNKIVMLHHRCIRFAEGVKYNYKGDFYALNKHNTVGRVFNFGGFCLAFNKSEFIRNGGFDERYALGFAGEDSYFVWWWKYNRKTQFGKHLVGHLWHPSPSMNPAYQKLRREYTLPLHNRLKTENAYPNGENPNWQRPEMIKGVKIWKS